MTCTLRLFAKAPTFQTAEGGLVKTTCHPHTVAKSSVPFNTKGRQSKTEEDSLGEISGTQQMLLLD